MKKILISLILLLCAYSIYAQIEATTTDGKKVILYEDGSWKYFGEESTLSETVFPFMKFNWSMGIDEIKEIETFPLVYKSEPLLLEYQGSAYGYNAQVVYNFYKSKLNTIMVKFSHMDPDINPKRTDYMKLKEIFAKIYGKPSTDTIVWRNELYKDNPSKIDEAILLGHVIYGATWSTTETLINLMLTRISSKPDLSLHYMDKNFNK